MQIIHHTSHFRWGNYSSSFMPSHMWCWNVSCSTVSDNNFGDCLGQRSQCQLPGEQSHSMKCTPPRTPIGSPLIPFGVNLLWWGNLPISTSLEYRRKSALHRQQWGQDWTHVSGMEAATQLPWYRYSNRNVKQILQCSEQPINKDWDTEQQTHLYCSRDTSLPSMSLALNS